MFLEVINAHQTRGCRDQRVQIFGASYMRAHSIKVKVKVKVRTLDIEPLRETPPQNGSGMARVLKGLVNDGLT